MKSSEMKKATKRILAMLLCTSMVLSSGVSASADEGMAAAQEQGHVHTEACYEKQNTGNLICTKAEVMEGHVHGDECYETTPKLTCEQEEHSHDDGCYTTETRDVCNDESEEHTCGDACVETEEVLTCTAEEHSHDDGCYETETNLICGQEEVEAHIHNDECYAWEEKLVCTLSETAPMAEEAAAQETVTEQPKEDKKAEEAVEAEEVNLQNDDETGIKVSVKSTSDVIPEDTKVVVAPMEMDEEYEAALAEAVSEFEVLGYTAYDISLKDAEDEDITLGENKVEVAIDFEELIPEGINAEEVKDVVLVHITTDEEEKLTAETVGTVKITEEKATVEFEADSFSPYVVTYLSEKEEVVEETVIEEPVVEDVVLTYTSEDEAYTATVTAAPEVLENVTAFEAVPVTDEEKITALTEQLTAKAAEAQKTSLGFENYEFKFMDAEGNEAVVEGKVKVSLSFAEARLPEAATAENVDAVDAALLETAEEGLEEINGLLSAEAGAVKEVVYTTEAPEELILAWSGDVYRTLPNYEDDDVVITLAGTEYALQNVVGFNVTPIKEEVEETKEQYAEVAKQLEEKIAEENEAKEEEKAVVGFLAYDITLVDAEGNELEPQGGVRVSMEYKEAAAPEAVAEAEEAEVTIHHFEEDEKGEVKQIVDMVAEETIEAGVTTTEKAEVEKAEFVTEGFSVFTITWTRKIGDQNFSLGQKISLLLANGSEYTELNISQTTIESLNKTISGEGTPPTLFMDSITLDGDNKSLFQITEDDASYKFVKAIVAEKEGDTYKAKFPALVVAIQAKNEIVKKEQGEITQVTEMKPRYMLEDTGLYRELENTEEIAFVYTAGNFTTTASYCAENGKALKSGQTYNFKGLLETGKTISRNYSMSDLLTQNKIDSSISEGNDTYNFAYVAVEHLGVRVLPKYIRYNGTSGAERLQYCVTEVTEEGAEEWIDVIDAKVSLVYRHTGVIPTENTAGIVDINLFNYNFEGAQAGDEIIKQGNVGTLYFGTGNNCAQYSTVLNDYSYNKWTGGFAVADNKVGANLALQGMVKNALGPNGYPVLKVGDQSLAALFDPTKPLGGNNQTDQNAKEVYLGLNHLFKKVGEYYRYDSDENYAYYTPENGNKNFTIYSDRADKSGANKNGSGNGIAGATRGDFMPFVPIAYPIESYKSDERAYHLGMTIGFDFIQPMQQSGDDMVFRFSGDDDVWVFVDGELLLDIGGIHSEASGEINFTQGTVTVKAGPKVEKDPSWGKPDYFELGLPKAFTMTEDGKSQSISTSEKITTTKEFNKIYTTGLDESKKTFKPNTAHRLEFFYLERGADMSNCMIEFNLQPTDVQSIKVGKEIVGTEEALYRDEEFQFKVFLQDDPESANYDVLPYGTEYTLYKEGTVAGTGKVGEDGIFSLKDGERAEFKNINTSLKYYVQEVSMNMDVFKSVQIDGKDAKYLDSAGNLVNISSTNTNKNNCIAQSAEVTVKDVREVIFYNTYAATQELIIEKKSAGAGTITDTFSFKVELEDRAGKLVPYKDGIYQVVHKDGTTTSGKTIDKKIDNETVSGIIEGISVGDKIVIEGLRPGTKFCVTEVGFDTNKYVTPVYEVTNCDAPSIVDKASGTIESNKNAQVTITNALKFDWKLIKISDSSKKGIPGANFDLKSGSGTVYKGTSGEDGIVTWKLNNQDIAAKDIPWGTYTLEETKAPNNYLKTSQEWTIVIGQSNVDIRIDGEPIEPDENDAGIISYTITIENTPAYKLPSTGGHGIYTTMLSGFALMLGAAYVWFTSRRKEMLQ